MKNPFLLVFLAVPLVQPPLAYAQNSNKVISYKGYEVWDKYGFKPAPPCLDLIIQKYNDKIIHISTITRNNKGNGDGENFQFQLYGVLYWKTQKYSSTIFKTYKEIDNIVCRSKNGIALDLRIRD